MTRMQHESWHNFLTSESGAVSVDWTVLTAAVAGMALAATAMIEDGISSLASDLEAQLRTQQVSDAFVVFHSAHFNALYDAGVIDEVGAESMFDIANAMTNATILTGIEEGILAYNDGDLSDEDIALLVAMASVGVQRNIISADDVNLVSTY
jgi:Flp pilus assembly pilin Flp